MSDPNRPESLWGAVDQVLREFAAAGNVPTVVSTRAPDEPGVPQFRAEHPDRWSQSSGDDDVWVGEVASRATAGTPAIALSSAGQVAGRSYRALRDTLVRPERPVLVVADEVEPSSPPFLEDVGILRALPGLSVVVPADAPSTRTALRALAGRAGPSYLRLVRRPLPTVTDGSFDLGRAAERRAGTDLTIAANGALIATGLAVADLLAQVGLSTRVLDFACVKPFDEPAVLRAARDTGAILVLEEQTVPTGLGTLIAATTSENEPVPVRRVGVPDLYLTAGEADDRLAHYGLGVERVRDEAWELLRHRGKVT